MPKPDWLVEREKDKTRWKPKVPKLCGECRFLGDPVYSGVTKWGKIKDNRQVYECSHNKGCYNTEETIGCDCWYPK